MLGILLENRSKFECATVPEAADYRLHQSCPSPRWSKHSQMIDPRSHEKPK
jgi:hypothetical protein